ncbi:phosphoglycerate mutase-like protein [Biscogniauxia mediterranea]|nr:phosphoglycerate mutase-like protein [Biscogniauxia mediterranea]
MAPIIDVIRHAEAWHNVCRSNIQDPGLTPDGEAQCYKLRDTYPFMDKVSHVVSSPAQRAVATALIAFDPVVTKGKKAILLPDLQETGAKLSDTGSPPKRLEALFKPHVDLSHLSERWYRRDADSDYAPDAAKVEARARRARRFIRRLARAARDDDDAHIVVVTHGGFAHFLTEDYEALGPGSFTDYDNAELKSYRFADLNADDDEDAPLVRVEWSADLKPLPAPEPPLDEQEKAARKSFAVDRVRLQALKERMRTLRRRKEAAVSPREREVASRLEASCQAAYADFMDYWRRRNAT